MVYDRRFIPKSPPKNLEEKHIRYLIIFLANIFSIILHYKLFGKIGILVGLLISLEAFTCWLYFKKNKVIIQIKG